MYMFWQYDKYPYLLGDKIDLDKPCLKIYEKEYFYSINYKNYFSPKFILSDEKGESLQNKLKGLKADLYDEENKLIEKYKKVLDTTLKSFLL